MISVTLSIPAVLAILLTMMILLGSERAQASLQPEIRRKLMHVSMGMLALSFPWIFSQYYHVWLLATLATLALLTVRCIRLLKIRIGGAIHTICRKSYGELCFPVAIATLYSLADGQLLLYMIPLLILTFADSLAALVGVYYGRYRYQSPDGSKTLEGSFTMFIVSMGCVIVSLSISGLMAFETILLIAFNLAMVITLVEAISWRGLDNFMIPVAGFFLLQAYLPLNATDLALYAVINSTFLVAVSLAQKRWPLRN